MPVYVQACGAILAAVFTFALTNFFTSTARTTETIDDDTRSYDCTIVDDYSD